MQVKITLTPYQREQAVNMRLKRGMLTPDTFEGPVFEDVAEFDDGEHYLKVKTAGGDVYLYSHGSVARVAIYPDAGGPMLDDGARL